MASAPVAAAVADLPSVASTAPDVTSPVAPVASAPGSTVADSTTTTATTSTTSSTTTTSIVESGALPPTEGPVIIVRPTTTTRSAEPAPANPATTTTSTTTLPGAPGTTAATTTTAPTAPPTTTTTIAVVTTTTTIAVLPPAGTFAIGSSAAGDVGSQEVLPIRPTRTPVNASVANYDVDRNPDPGLTLVRTADALLSAAPDGVQTWIFSDRLAELPRLTVATIYASAATAGAAGDSIEVQAGIFRCNPTRLNCDELRSDTVVVAAPVPGDFTPLIFDLSSPERSTAPTGWHFELRVAVPEGSDSDIWIAYDAADAPAVITLVR